MAKGLKYVRLWLPAGTIVLVAALGLIYRPDNLLRVGTASISQVLCEEVFIAGLSPQRVFDEEVRPRPGLRPLLNYLRYDIDTEQRAITTRWAGHFASVAQDLPGYGCRIVTAVAKALPTPLLSPAASRPSIEGPTPVATENQALESALEHAFAEPAHSPYRQVRAVVVMHDGHVITERYAQGITPTTPLLGYSATKSVMNALVGILVQEGKLRVDQPTGLAAWNRQGDWRKAITLDQLLRMTSGLDLTEDDSGSDPVSKMLFRHTDDMAAYAETARLQIKPGTRWAYSSGNTLIVASMVRNAVGGSAVAVQAFAQRELFGPLGMQHVTMELDGAGTPVGSTRILASARDWAHFGQLYLDDGILDGKRLLPTGWVRYSTTPTLGTDYGAGFWLNSSDADDARWRVRHGMPPDSFYASGLFGQRIVIVPSQRLVIVRMGQTMDPPDFDIQGLVQLTAEVVAAVQSR
jgi:CubicO group peptidase (beta-lactamase class C family)